MQYYPQHYFGFVVDNNIAEKLHLNEAYDEYEMSYEEDGFFEGFEKKFGIEPYKFTDTTYERGGYVQGLSGFDWDRTYVCFAPSQVGGDKWNDMISTLEKLGVPVEEGHWSELG
tara:strand:+ start:3305 stop:3646 length:342 start_codon:yes stop_codon:yes gene_type:complete